MLDFGMPMGPATLSDLTGIDINYHVNQTFAKRLGDRATMSTRSPRPSTRLGDYGRKTGRGYFGLQRSAEPKPNPIVSGPGGDRLPEGAPSAPSQG